MKKLKNVLWVALLPMMMRCNKTMLVKNRTQRFNKDQVCYWGGKYLKSCECKVPLELGSMVVDYVGLECLNKSCGYTNKVGSSICGTCRTPLKTTTKIKYLDHIDTLCAHTRAALGMIKAGKNHIISIGTDTYLKLIKVTDSENMKLIKWMRGDKGAINCIIKLNDNLFAAGGGENVARVWGYDEEGFGSKSQKWLTCKKILRGHTDRVSCMAYPEYGTLVTGSWDNSLIVWDYFKRKWKKKKNKSKYEQDDPRKVRVLTGHTDNIYCLEYIGNSLVLSGSKDTTFKIWRYSTGQCLLTNKKHGSTVTYAEYLGKTKFLTSGADSSAIVWKYRYRPKENLIDLKKFTLREPIPSSYLVFGNKLGKKQVVLAGQEGVLWVYDYKNKTYSEFKHKGPVPRDKVVFCSLIFTDSVILTGDMSGNIRKWVATDRKPASDDPPTTRCSIFGGFC